MDIKILFKISDGGSDEKMDRCRKHMNTVGGSMKKRLTVAMFGQKRLTREGGVEIVVKGALY